MPDQTKQTKHNTQETKVQTQMPNSIIRQYLERIGYTPNGIIALSSIFAGAGLYNLYYHNLPVFTLYAILFYIFNDISPNVNLNQFKNAIVLVITLYIFYDRYQIGRHSILLIILAALFVLGIISNECQKTTDSNTNSFCSRYVDYLKYLQPGTAIFIGILVAYYLNKTLDTVSDLSVTNNVIDITSGISNGQITYPSTTQNLMQYPSHNLMQYPSHNLTRCPTHIQDLIAFNYPSSTSYRFSYD
jgi:hypothetical protein